MVVFEKQILKYFSNLSKLSEIVTIDEKKNLLKTLIRKICFDDKNHQISLELYPDYSVVPMWRKICSFLIVFLPHFAQKIIGLSYVRLVF